MDRLELILDVLDPKVSETELWVRQVIDDTTHGLYDSSLKREHEKKRRIIIYVNSQVLKERDNLWTDKEAILENEADKTNSYKRQHSDIFNYVVGFKAYSAGAIASYLVDGNKLFKRVFTIWVNVGLL